MVLFDTLNILDISIGVNILILFLITYLINIFALFDKRDNLSSSILLVSFLAIVRTLDAYKEKI